MGMRVPPAGPGAVHNALAEHAGALEAIVAQLVRRMEGFLSESQALHCRFEARHGHDLVRCRLAVQLWLNRWEAGSVVLKASQVASTESAEDMMLCVAAARA